jgi:hypothetical protein
MPYYNIQIRSDIVMRYEDIVDISSFVEYFFSHVWDDFLHIILCLFLEKDEEIKERQNVRIMESFVLVAKKMPLVQAKKTEN